MARKPNYAFERNARARAKAEKKEAKRQAKLAAKATKAPDEPEGAAQADPQLAETELNEAPPPPRDN